VRKGRGRRGERAEEEGRKDVIICQGCHGFAPRKNFLAMPLCEIGPLNPAIGSGEGVS